MSEGQVVQVQGSGFSWCFKSSVFFFHGRQKLSLWVLVWCTIQPGGPERLEVDVVPPDRSQASIFAALQTLKSEIFHHDSTRTGLCAAGDQGYGQSHAEPLWRAAEEGAWLRSYVK